MNCEGLCCSLKDQLSPLVMIPLLDRPPPHSSLPSLFKLGAEQTGLFSRKGTQQWIMPSLPHWSLSTTCPCTPYPLSHYLPPSQSHCASGVSWSTPGIISSLLWSYVPLKCYVCMSPMLFMVCIGPGSSAVLSRNCVVQVWVYMPHYTKSKAWSLREERRVKGSGWAIMQFV